MNWLQLTDNERLISDVNEKLDQIYNYICNSELFQPLGVLGGCNGSILFLYQMYQYKNNDIYLQELYKRVESLCSIMGLVKMPSFCNGYAGIAWVLRFLHCKEVLDFDNIDKSMADIDLFIYNNLLDQISNYDFLHGSLGLAFYFVSFNSPYSEKALKQFVDFLDKNKENDINGGYKWRTKIFTQVQSIGWAYNLGMAHGMASIVVFLALCVKKKIYIKKTLPLLKGVVEFYLRNKNPNNYASSYSFWKPLDTNIYSESRLGWCYGDIGISCALIQAAIILGDDSLKSYACMVIDKTLVRIHSESKDITEANICHGTSGLSFMYNCFYQITHEDKYRIASLYWLDRTLCLGHEQGKHAGFTLPDAVPESSTMYGSYLSIINGVSGIGSVLIASVSSVEQSWSNCIMLNNY